MEEKQKKKSKKEKLDEIEIKNKEKLYFDSTFQYLCDLENELSSDNNSKEKIYHKQIEEKAKEKKMQKIKETFKSKTMAIDKNKNKKNRKQIKLTTKKNFSEDLKNEEEKNNFENNENNLLKNEEERNEENEEKNKENEENKENIEKKEKKKEKEKLNKFGKKALRKIFKKLTSTFNKNDINLMIWEVDTNLDGYIDYNEYENMYKRCVIDEKEREPKKLYHLIQFLMFDKEKKGYITEEDTLEVLCIRNTNGLDNAINDIFGVETNENGKKIIKKRETLNYVEFADIMHKLNLKKRMQLMNKKKIFCDKIKEEAIQNAKNNNLQNQ